MDGKTEQEIKDGKLADVKVELPVKFLFLQHYHTVKGWHDASNSKIWANEVFYIKETMTVTSAKGGMIAQGLYKEIKPKVNEAGGRYHRSVYVMLEDGSIVNLSFKGAVVGEWTNFMSDNGKLVHDQWIEVNSAKDQKKGSIKYSTPEFTIGAKLTKKDEAMADAAAAKLQAYLDKYFNKDQQSKDVEMEAEEVELDF
jgi:hypothetical protein